MDIILSVCATGSQQRWCQLVRSDDEDYCGLPSPRMRLPFPFTQPGCWCACLVRDWSRKLSNYYNRLWDMPVSFKMSTQSAPIHVSPHSSDRPHPREQQIPFTITYCRWSWPARSSVIFARCKHWFCHCLSTKQTVRSTFKETRQELIRGWDFRTWRDVYRLTLLFIYHSTTHLYFLSGIFF